MIGPLLIFSSATPFYRDLIHFQVRPKEIVNRLSDLNKELEPPLTKPDFTTDSNEKVYIACHDFMLGTHWLWVAALWNLLKDQTSIERTSPEMRKKT